ncbi:MAG: hypothetical protein WBP70_18665, partial [Terriglobales bacterium]
AWNTPIAINNQGQVVGFGNIAGDENAAENPAAFIWTQTNKMQEIPPYGTDTNDAAFDINEKGQVVGNSFNVNTGTSRATLWQNNTLNDLNTLVIQPTSLYLTLAQGINDAGEVTGTAIDTTTNETVGFIAVPVFDGSGNPENTVQTKADANPRPVVLTERMRKQLPVFIRMMLGSAEAK